MTDRCSRPFGTLRRPSVFTSVGDDHRLTALPQLGPVRPAGPPSFLVSEAEEQNRCRYLPLL